MFKRANPGRLPKPSVRKATLGFEVLEDRSMPHSGVTVFTAGITPDAAPAGIVLGPDGNLWFTEFAADRIARMTRTGTVTEFTLPAGRGPLNITVGPDNNVWFTESDGDRIGRINPAAGDDAAIQASITAFVVPGAGSAPHDIAAGPDGALWFTQTGSDEIGRITTAGVVTEFAVPGAGSAPAGIAAGPDGALWFTESGSGEIGRITTAGVVTNEFVIPVPANGFSDPEDITAGPAGALYFTDFGRDQIGRITTDGVITQFSLPVGRGPHDIVAAPDGNLYFTESASSRIGKLPAGSLAVGRPTSGSPPLEEFDFIARDSVPLGLALDGSDDIFFTLNAGNGIGTFEAHLAQITAAATGPTVQVLDTHLNEVRSFTPFPDFQGTVSVAVQDLAGVHGIGNGNGVPDVIVGAGPGGAPLVKVFDGSDNSVLASFFAFDPSFRGGVSLGSDDVNGDGRADIIVAAGPGGAPHVKIIDGFKLNQLQPNGQIAESALLASFFAFSPNFTGGVSLAAGDLNRDGKAEIIVGAGSGGGPQVKVIDAAKLNQFEADGQIANSSLLGSFFAYDPSFRGGVFVAVAFNTSQRDIVVGAGPGGGPHVKVVNSSQFGQLQPNGQIADSALLASFLAFAPSLRGGVRVAADDINSDGQAEIIVGAGPGGGPHVKFIDGFKTNQLQPDGQIADSALLGSFLTGDPGFTGGVFVGADADHRDGPIFGPPGVTISNSQRDINDVYVFQSPVTPTNTVLVMDVSPFSSRGTPAAFVPGLIYDLRIANRDLLNVTDDLVFRVTFGPADAAGVQDAEVRALPAARFPGTAGVLVKGLTGSNFPVRGVGGNGTAQFRAAEHDDPFFFDAAAFSRFLNGSGLSNGTTADNAAGKYPSGTSNNGAGDSDADGLGFDTDETNFDYNGVNFFANANTLSIILEIPSTVLAGLPAGTPLTPDQDAIGVWGRTELNGVQVDRMGRPAINTALIPPVPRGSNFPADGSALNRFDVRSAFNAGHPRDDRTVFADDMAAVLAAVYPIGGNGQAPTVASLLLPDILIFDPTSPAGFFGDTIGTLGQPDFFLAGGRKLSDDIISVEVSILTDPDTPFNLDGGADQLPLVATQNVADDNGLNLTDGSKVGPGTPLAGTARPAMFPYIGARNAAPSDVPGGNPPP